MITNEQRWIVQGENVCINNLWSLRTCCKASVNFSVVNSLRSTRTATPRLTATATLCSWSANNGIATIGIPKWIASVMLFNPPWVTNAFSLGWSRNKCIHLFKDSKSHLLKRSTWGAHFTRWTLGYLANSSLSFSGCSYFHMNWYSGKLANVWRMATFFSIGKLEQLASEPKDTNTAPFSLLETTFSKV